MNLVFPASAVNGTMQCIDVAIIETTSVNYYETFTVKMTTLHSAVALGNNVTTVTIVNVDGMYYVCSIMSV